MERRLEQFVESYLGAEETPDIGAAIKRFARDEGREAAEGLRDEIRQWLTVGAPLDEVRRFLSQRAQVLLSESDEEVRAVFLEAFELLSNELVESKSGAIQKPFDVFISYSSQDRDVASRLALSLKDKGFAVWLDSWEILVGHNIVDAVYKGIADSEFLVIVLSPASISSRWVQEELTTSKIEEIERRRVTVLPVLAEQCDVPTSLRNKRYADLTKSWDEGLRELTTAIQLHRAASRDVSQLHGASLTFRKLQALRQTLVRDAEGLGFTVGMASKDVTIGPPDNVDHQLDLTQLLPLIEALRVEIKGWGAEPFPYEPMRQDDITRRMHGVRLVDTSPWPYQERSFHFWEMGRDSRFFQRSSLTEDFAKNEQGALFLRGKLAVEWATLDIARPLVFANRMLSRQKQIGAIGVVFTWGGLNDRVLELLKRRRMGFRQRRQSREDLWTYSVEIGLSTDVLDAAKSAARSLFWLFGWEPSGDILEDYLGSMIEGQMPR